MVGYIRNFLHKGSLNKCSEELPQKILEAFVHKLLLN